MTDSGIIVAFSREFPLANTSSGSHLRRSGVLLLRVLNVLDHVSFNSHLREWSSIKTPIVFLNIESNYEFLDVHLLLLVLQVVFEVLPGGWQLYNDHHYLEGFTQHYTL